VIGRVLAALAPYRLLITIIGTLALGAGGYVWGRHDGRALERSASLAETVRVQSDAVKAAGDQLTRDQAIEIARTESMTRLLATVSDLLARPPAVVTQYKEVQTHGAATVRCPAGVSAEFVQHWNSAADAADHAS
jgi:hypothetical protein